MEASWAAVLINRLVDVITKLIQRELSVMVMERLRECLPRKLNRWRRLVNERAPKMMKKKAMLLRDFGFFIVLALSCRIKETFLFTSAYFCG